MNQQELRDRAVAALNEAAFDDDWWPEASKRMDEACGAMGNILVIGDDGAAGAVEISLARIYFRGQRSAYWERRYFNRLYSMDERIPRLRRLPPGQLVSVRSLYATPLERKRSEVYSEFVRGETQNGLNMRLALPDSANITWQIANPVGGGDWVPDQLKMIEGLKPHLLHYARVRRALEKADAFGRSMETILENNYVGVMHLDRRRRIVEANDAALRHLHDGSLLTDDAMGLRAASNTDDRKLQRLLASALNASSGGSMRLRRPDAATPLMMHVTPITASSPDWGAGRIGALALIVDAKQRLRIDPSLLTEVLGLTPSEAKIAALLAEGLTSRQAGTASGRSEGTVRWHLHRIFLKLGIERQAQLVQLVRTLGWIPGGRGA
ncbi:MAG: PAS domain-containing protein [Gammaproteobacteria bacterium]|nr:PAS domain-containing protein [Gammaproteobacteria bacterium]